MLVRHLDFRFAQQSAEIGHTFFAADVIGERLEHLVFQNGAVAAQDDLGVRGVLARQRDHFLHLMHQRHHEGYSHVIVALLELADELAFGGILEHHRRSLKVLGDIFQGENHVDGARTENSLRPGHLAIQQLITDRWAIPILRSDWAANTSQ